MTSDRVEALAYQMGFLTAKQLGRFASLMGAFGQAVSAPAPFSRKRRQWVNRPEILVRPDTANPEKSRERERELAAKPTPGIRKARRLARRGY